ncbi:hypothetical protein LCGC14_2652950 [marine sediment metagenome]|uniref:Uncharacterized protein n=1 Tax=marine sediment metagenome TaxID=412755 RepID=A0A0F9C4N4_9ZZZZ
MTDKQTVRPKLSPAYRPATFDDRIEVVFIGNTSLIDHLAFTEIKGPDDKMYPSVDPYQMVAAGEYLKMKGLQAIQQGELINAQHMRDQEQEKAKKDALKRVIVTDKLPPDDFIAPGILKG